MRSLQTDAPDGTVFLVIRKMKVASSGDQKPIFFGHLGEHFLMPDLVFGIDGFQTVNSHGNDVAGIDLDQ